MRRGEVDQLAASMPALIVVAMTCQAAAHAPPASAVNALLPHPRGRTAPAARRSERRAPRLTRNGSGPTLDPRRVKYPERGIFMGNTRAYCGGRVRPIRVNRVNAPGGSVESEMCSGT